MFPRAETKATTPVKLPKQVLPAETGAELERVGSDLVPPLEVSNASATADSAPKAAPNTQSNAAKKKVSTSSSRNKTKKLMPPPQPSKRGSGWQQYIREEYSNTSLPEAVYAVLQHQADAVLEIAAVVRTIFTDKLPQEVGNKARRQVTNILSNGALKNKWYRGQPGHYSMSKAAAKTNVG